MEYTLKNRAKIFRSLPVSDWHKIVEFEVIIKNYIKLNEILNKK